MWKNWRFSGQFILCSLDYVAVKSHSLLVDHFIESENVTGKFRIKDGKVADFL